MKKRSDKFIALLLCAFMAFSLIAAAADVPVEPCAECGLTEGHSESCSQNVAPTNPEPSAEPEPTADPEPPVDPEPTPESQEPVTLEPASLNGDAAGMNFTVSGDLPQNSKLQVKAIDVSCNDFIVGNYISVVALPQGAAMAYELSILLVEEQAGVKQETP